MEGCWTFQELQTRVFWEGIGVRDEGVEDFQVMKVNVNSVELVASEILPCKFAKFNNFLGMPLAGKKKEINSLLRNFFLISIHFVPIGT